MTGLDLLLAVIGIAAALSLIMSGAWSIWYRTRNSGWVDATWTFGLGAVGALGALAPALSSGAATGRQGLVAALIVLWSLRLGLHIVGRTRRVIDDPRYAALLRGWGGGAALHMFWLLQKQALVSVPLGLSIVLAGWNPTPIFRPQDIAAVAVLLAAVIGEGVADAQLRRFRARSAAGDQICDRGLWAWSRHPNYFFEWMGWFAYPLLAIDFAGDDPWGWIALAGPLCMYWLLVHVSGIPPLEAHMLERRREAFRAYQARTNAFFPAPPRIA